MRGALRVLDMASGDYKVTHFNDKKSVISIYYFDTFFRDEAKSDFYT